MALDVLPLSTDSSSTSPTKSSSKISRNDHFLKELAAAAAKSAKANSTSAKAASAKSKAPADAETPPAGKSRTGSAQSSGKPKSSSRKTADSSDRQSASDNSTSDAAAASKGNSAANGVSKGRVAGRGNAAKRGGSQNAGTQAAGSSAEDPSSDTSNASGLSLLQLLAQSLEGDTARSTDGTTTTTEDKAANDNGANADANAIALAQFTQALAAALGGATAALQTGASNPSVADGSGVSVTDVTKGASARDLVALLAQNIAAESQGKSDVDAPQSDAAATKDSATNTGTADPNSLAHFGPARLGLAQMGVTSHFSLQQSQSASNTGELKSPVGSAAWNHELGAQLTWMTQKGLESGSLRVSPEHLGPVEVQITVLNGDASVWFGASHPDTRAALEQALPRLREMFASQGMTLTDSGVSRESPRNQTKSDSPQAVASVSAVGSADVSVTSAVRISLGLVDTYA